MVLSLLCRNGTRDIPPVALPTLGPSRAFRTGRRGALGGESFGPLGLCLQTKVRGHGVRWPALEACTSWTRPQHRLPNVRKSGNLAIGFVSCSPSQFQSIRSYRRRCLGFFAEPGSRWVLASVPQCRSSVPPRLKTWHCLLRSSGTAVFSLFSAHD